MSSDGLTNIENYFSSGLAHHASNKKTTPMQHLLDIITAHARRALSHRALPLVLVASLAVAITACSGADGASDQEAAVSAANTATRVETLVLSPVRFADVIEVTGTIEAVDDATLSAQTAGTIVSLVELGRYVAQGAAVAQLDPQIPRANVEQAQATVEAAEAAYALALDNYDRQTPLFQDSIISAIEYENVRAQLSQARAQLGQARASLASAEKQLQNTFVRTPFGGVVERHFAQRGEQVTPGMPVARVVNTSLVKVAAGVPERYAGDIEVGTSVEVRLNAYNVGSRAGRISFVGSAIDTDSRTFPIEIELPNRDNNLKPQMVAQLLVTRHEIPDAVAIPRSAALRDEIGSSVFIVRRGEAPVVERRGVTLGSSYNGQVVVLEGLDHGDEIVVSGQTVLTDGDTVQVVARDEQQDVLATRDLD